MSVIINNITEGNCPTGIQQYEVLINRKHITFFEHNRSYNGLAQCLRDAADAIDAIDPDAVPRLNKTMSLDEMSEFIAQIQNHKAKHE